MKIFVATYGSHGDVRPYIALGRGLRKAGFQVVLGTSERFRGLVEEFGLEYGYMSDDLLAIIDTTQGKNLIENTTNIFDVVKQSIKLAKTVKPMHDAQMRETWEIAKSFMPDFILYHPKIIAAPHIAEKMGVGCALATPIPMFVPTSERPFMVLPNLKLGGWYNRLSYKIIAFLTKILVGKKVKEFREEIGLARLKKFDQLKTGDGKDIPVIHAFSEAVLSRPTDWPDNAYVTGYWFLDRGEDWTPPDALRDFLKSGPPPVYIGFGSMTGRNSRHLAEIVVESLRLVGARGIIATGWGGMVSDVLPDSVLKIESAPHDWLFPRVSVVAHHGGAGTTAAGLRAGKPSVVVPFFGDQPFWGRLVHSLGVGPRPIPRKKLTVEKLAEAIRDAMSNPNMKRNAEEIGGKIKSEDGVRKAVAIIEQLMVRQGSRKI